MNAKGGQCPPYFIDRVQSSAFMDTTEEIKYLIRKERAKLRDRESAKAIAVQDGEV